MIAVSNGAIKVQCFRVKLSKVNDKITIASNFFPSFFLASEDIEGLNGKNFLGHSKQIINKSLIFYRCKNRKPKMGFTRRL